ncbi:MAG: creatininase family protein [Armatimonadota bacterium]|nr:MAG: creatininase family protein [Armatimonadota bacterium]
MPRKVRYEEMLPHEIVEARTACPVAYVPLGGVEWHGEHNCVGLDTVKMHALAMKCAEAHGGLVMPALFFGEPRESHLMEATSGDVARIAEKMGLPAENFAPGYMHATRVEEDERYLRLLLHVLFQMQSLGFRAVVLMAGHYPLLRHARAAVEMYHSQGTCRVWACTGYELVRDEIPDAGDHAAAWETSLMLALRPDLVDLSRLPAGDDLGDLVGVGGRDPRKFASEEYGRKGVEAVVRRVGGKVKELLA